MYLERKYLSKGIIFLKSSDPIVLKDNYILTSFLPSPSFFVFNHVTEVIIYLFIYFYSFWGSLFRVV